MANVTRRDSSIITLDDCIENIIYISDIYLCSSVSYYDDFFRLVTLVRLRFAVEYV